MQLELLLWYCCRRNSLDEAHVHAGMYTVCCVCYTFFPAYFPTFLNEFIYLFFCSHMSAATLIPHCLTSLHVPHSFEMEMNHTGEYILNRPPVIHEM